MDRALTLVTAMTDAGMRLRIERGELNLLEVLDADDLPRLQVQVAGEDSLLIEAQLIEGEPWADAGRGLVDVLSDWAEHPNRDVVRAAMAEYLGGKLAQGYDNVTVLVDVYGAEGRRWMQVSVVDAESESEWFFYREEDGSSETPRTLIMPTLEPFEREPSAPAAPPARVAAPAVGTLATGSLEPGRGLFRRSAPPLVSAVSGTPEYVIGEFFTRPTRGRDGELVTETGGPLPANAQPVPLAWSIDSAARALAQTMAQELVAQGARPEVRTMLDGSLAGTLQLVDEHGTRLLTVTMHPGNSSITFEVRVVRADPARLDLVRRAVQLIGGWAQLVGRDESLQNLLAELDTLQQSNFTEAAVTVEVRGPQPNDATNTMGNRRLQLLLQVERGKTRTFRYGEREAAMAELDPDGRRGSRGHWKGTETLRSDLFNAASPDDPQYVRPEELVAAVRAGDAAAALSLLQQFKARVQAEGVPARVVRHWLRLDRVDVLSDERLHQAAREFGVDRYRTIIRLVGWLDRYTHIDHGTRRWLLTVFSALPADTSWQPNALGVWSFVAEGIVVFQVDPGDNGVEIGLQLAETDQVRAGAAVRLIDMVGGWRAFGDRDMAVAVMRRVLGERTASGYRTLILKAGVTGAENNRHLTLTMETAASAATPSGSSTTSAVAFAATKSTSATRHWSPR